MNRSREGSRRSRTLAAFGCLALAFVFVELMLHLSVHVSPAAARLLLTPFEFSSTEDAALGRRPHPRHPEHDRRGWRNETALDQADIVALGDSQTYGAGVHPEDAWPRVLKDQFGLSIYNMAFGGFGTTQLLELWEEAMDLGPELVIVSVYFGNDLYDSFYHTHVVGWRREAVGGSSSIRRRVDELEGADPLLQHVQGLMQTSGPAESWVARLRWSKTFALIRGIRATWNHRSAVRRTYDAEAAWQTRQEQAASRDDEEAVEVAGVRTILTIPYRSLALNLQDLRIREGLRITNRNLVELAAKADEAGVELCVLLVPTKERVFATVDPSLAELDGAELLLESEAEATRSVLSTLRDEGVPVLHALTPLADSLRSGVRIYRPSRDGHPSPQGHLVLASLVVEWVRSGGL